MRSVMALAKQLCPHPRALVSTLSGVGPKDRPLLQCPNRNHRKSWVWSTYCRSENVLIDLLPMDHDWHNSNSGRCKMPEEVNHALAMDLRGLPVNQLRQLLLHF